MKGICGITDQVKLERIDDLLKLCDKYQSERFEKIVRDRLLSLLGDYYCHPWSVFVIACRMEWQEVAKEAIRKFGTWRYPESHGPNWLPEHLPQSVIDQLSYKHAFAFVRACKDCRNGTTVDCNKAAGQFSFVEPP